MGAISFPEPPFPDYALLDSGEGAKLERFGAYRLARPDPQALWRPRLGPEDWERADLRFERESDRGGRWVPGRRASAGELRRGTQRDAARREPWSWIVTYGPARFHVRPTPFKHVGLFPEQACNWEWIAGLAPALRRDASGSRPAFLNLFAYTGAASILAAHAGYDVTHVDASRASLDWARENASASGLAERDLRFVLDDALAFARREVRRGRRYAGIALDPPHYGRGPKGEKWQLETDVAPLLEACRELLAEESFLVLSMYAIGYSPLAFTNMLEEWKGGQCEAGELVLTEERLESAPDAPDVPTRRLPCGFCVRWWRGIEGGGTHA